MESNNGIKQWIQTMESTIESNNGFKQLNKTMDSNNGIKQWIQTMESNNGNSKALPSTCTRQTLDYKIQVNKF